MGVLCEVSAPFNHIQVTTLLTRNYCRIVTIFLTIHLYTAQRYCVSRNA